jgi:hypothetical protein
MFLFLRWRLLIAGVSHFGVLPPCIWPAKAVILPFDDSEADVSAGL